MRVALPQQPYSLPNAAAFDDYNLPHIVNALKAKLFDSEGLPEIIADKLKRLAGYKVGQRMDAVLKFHGLPRGVKTLVAGIAEMGWVSWFSQKRLSKKYGMSQSNVSRSIKQACAAGLLHKERIGYGSNGNRTPRDIYIFSPEALLMSEMGIEITLTPSSESWPGDGQLFFTAAPTYQFDMAPAYQSDTPVPLPDPYVPETSDDNSHFRASDKEPGMGVTGDERVAPPDFAPLLELIRQGRLYQTPDGFEDEDYLRGVDAAMRCPGVILADINSAWDSLFNRERARMIAIAEGNPRIKPVWDLSSWLPDVAAKAAKRRDRAERAAYKAKTDAVEDMDAKASEVLRQSAAGDADAQAKERGGLILWLAANLPDDDADAPTPDQSRQALALADDLMSLPPDWRRYITAHLGGDRPAAAPESPEPDGGAALIIRIAEFWYG